MHWWMPHAWCTPMHGIPPCMAHHATARRASAWSGRQMRLPWPSLVNNSVAQLGCDRGLHQRLPVPLLSAPPAAGLNVLADRAVQSCVQTCMLVPGAMDCHRRTQFASVNVSVNVSTLHYLYYCYCLDIHAPSLSMRCLCGFLPAGRTAVAPLFGDTHRQCLVRPYTQGCCGRLFGVPLHLIFLWKHSMQI